MDSLNNLWHISLPGLFSIAVIYAFHFLKLFTHIRTSNSFFICGIIWHAMMKKAVQ